MQAVAFADLGQRRLNALIGLYQAHARQVFAHHGHPAFNGRHAIRLDARHDVLPRFAVIARLKGQIGHVVRLRRFADDEMAAVQRLFVVAQHGGIKQAGVKTAHRTVYVRHNREDFVVLPFQRLPHHAAAAVGRVGHALAGVNL